MSAAHDSEIQLIQMPDGYPPTKFMVPRPFAQFLLKPVQSRGGLS